MEYYECKYPKMVRVHRDEKSCKSYDLLGKPTDIPPHVLSAAYRPAADQLFMKIIESFERADVNEYSDMLRFQRRHSRLREPLAVLWAAVLFCLGALCSPRRGPPEEANIRLLRAAFRAALAWKRSPNRLINEDTRAIHDEIESDASDSALTP